MGSEDVYKRQTADLSNVGGRPAGSITAAKFLSEFVGDTPWAHLDIAGTAYGDGKLPYQRKGAYGFPTRMLIHWVRSRAGLQNPSVKIRRPGPDHGSGRLHIWESSLWRTSPVSEPQKLRLRILRIRCKS